MLEIIQNIKESDLVESFIIERLVNEESVKFIKVRVVFKNNTLLFIKKFLSANQHKYSYHWQTKNNKMIRRWDNASHGKKKNRFFDHCHIGDHVYPTKPISLDEILAHVREYK